MMTGFDDTRRRVKIDDILVSCGVTKEDPCEIVPVKFRASRAGTFDTYSGPEHLEVGDVRLTAMPPFKRSVEGR